MTGSAAARLLAAAAIRGDLQRIDLLPAEKPHRRTQLTRLLAAVDRALLRFPEPKVARYLAIKAREARTVTWLTRAFTDYADSIADLPHDPGHHHEDERLAKTLAATTDPAPAPTPAPTTPRTPPAVPDLTSPVTWLTDQQFAAPPRAAASSAQPGTSTARISPRPWQTRSPASATACPNQPHDHHPNDPHQLKNTAETASSSLSGRLGVIYQGTAQRSVRGQMGARTRGGVPPREPSLGVTTRRDVSCRWQRPRPDETSAHERVPEYAPGHSRSTSGNPTWPGRGVRRYQLPAIGPGK